MLKKLSLTQLEQTKTNFFKNLKNLIEKYRYSSLKELVNNLFKTSNEIYFLQSNEIILKLEKKWEKINIIDLKENISLELNSDEFKKLNNNLKTNNIIKQSKQQKSILDILFEKYKKWQLNTIFGKPFLIYDIETVWNINDLKNTKFMLWYVTISSEDHSQTIKYRYIWEKSLKKFVDFMLEFDWYIIWFNNIAFDNPVVIHNVWYDKEKLTILNQKSLDIFLFINQLTWKRLWLNKIATSLVNIKKTLSSGLEWEKYLKEYLKTNDQNLLNKVKTYCKNDVKMTLGVFLYLLENNSLFIDWKDFNYNLETLVSLWKISQKIEKQTNWLFID